MKNQYLALVALLAGAEYALASTKQTVYCQNAVNCDPKQTGPNIAPTLSPTVAVPAKRDVEWLNGVVKRDVEAMDTLTSLFRRDPEYEQAMSILARNAAAADAATQKIVSQIMSGTVPQEIVKAAKAKGLITGNGPAASGGKGGSKGGSKKAARDLETRATGSKGASKGGKSGAGGSKGGKSGGGDGPQTPSQIAQHIMSGGHIPPEITKALKESPHYEHGGSSKGGASGGKGGKSAAGGAKGGKGAAKKGTKARRDAGSFFDFDVSDIFARGEKISFSDVKGLVEKAEKDSKAKDEILKDINGDKKVQKGFKKLSGTDDDDDDVTLDDLSSLVSDADKKQKKAIEKFFSKDKISGVTSKLIKKFNKKGKRDAEFEDFLEARDPEAEAEAEFEDVFAREAEPEYEDIFVRDAEAESFYDFE